MKTFTLNKIQKLSISENHKLYNDVLMASLANQSIHNIVSETFLYKLGYYDCGEHWHNYNSIIEKVIVLK